MGAGILGFGASFTIQQAIRKRSFAWVANNESHPPDAGQHQVETGQRPG
jgi:hypothetical protein